MNRVSYASQSRGQSFCDPVKIGLVVSEWNIDITTNLLKGAEDKLIELGVNRKNIIISWVPGSFELVFGSKELSKKNLDAVNATKYFRFNSYNFLCFN